jgi:hypothetical protein
VCWAFSRPFTPLPGAQEWPRPRGSHDSWCRGATLATHIILSPPPPGTRFDSGGSWSRGLALLPSALLPPEPELRNTSGEKKWRACPPRGAPAFSSRRASPEPAAARVRRPPSASVRGGPGAARGPSPASRRRTPRSRRRCVLTAQQRLLYLVPVLLFRAGEVDP